MTDLRQRSDAHIQRIIARCERVMRHIECRSIGRVLYGRSVMLYDRAHLRWRHCQYEQWRRRQEGRGDGR